MELKQFTATDQQGNALAEPSVTVYVAGTSDLATGLEDASGNALSNPFTGGEDGLIQFAAPQGDYLLAVMAGGRSQNLRVRFGGGAGGGGGGGEGGAETVVFNATLSENKIVSLPAGYYYTYGLATSSGHISQLIITHIAHRYENELHYFSDLDTRPATAYIEVFSSSVLNLLVESEDWSDATVLISFLGVKIPEEELSPEVTLSPPPEFSIQFIVQEIDEFEVGINNSSLITGNFVPSDESLIIRKIINIGSEENENFGIYEVEFQSDIGDDYVYYEYFQDRGLFITIDGVENQVHMKDWSYDEETGLITATSFSDLFGLWPIGASVKIRLDYADPM